MKREIAESTLKEVYINAHRLSREAMLDDLIASSSMGVLESLIKKYHDEGK